MEHIFGQSISGIIPWAVGGIILVIIWGVRSHYQVKGDITELKQDRDTTKQWQTTHDAQTGTLQQELHDFRVEMADRMGRFEGKLDAMNGGHK